MRTFAVTCIGFTAVVGCVADEQLSEDESALTDSALPDVPGIPAPSNMGRYCSMVDSTAKWSFTWANNQLVDACATRGSLTTASAQVKRAGLFSTTGSNNVMVQCSNGLLLIGRGTGAAALSSILSQVPVSAPNCVFTIAPTQLPAFGSPLGSVIPSGGSVFDYDWKDVSWNAADFGGSGMTISLDRTGSPSSGASEYAYDWSVPRDTPIRAVADGVIVGSQWRTVWPLCGQWPDGLPQQSLPYSPQGELFLETQVGTGRFAEHFVAAYHHMDQNPATNGALTPADLAAISANYQAWNPPGNPNNQGYLPPIGTHVHKGDIIGYVGESGNSKGSVEGQPSYHLDFSVFRLTNLTGARSYTFAALQTQYTTCTSWSGYCSTSGYAGVNGAQGVIDPFGWAAPQGIDPLAYKYIGLPTQWDAPASVSQEGAFSIRLWTDPNDFGLPHTGSANAF